MAVQDRLKTLLLGTKTFRTVTKQKQLMPLQILILWILELMRFAVSKLWYYRQIKCQRKGGNWGFLCRTFKGG